MTERRAQSPVGGAEEAHGAPAGGEEGPVQPSRDHRWPHRLLDAGPTIALIVAFVVAGAALAWAEPPAATPETALATALVALVAACLAVFAPRRRHAVTALVVVAASVLVVMPVGAQRAAVIGFATVAALVVSLEGARRRRDGDRLGLAAGAALALALQLLLRCDELLAASQGAWEALRLVGPALLAGGAVATLSRQRPAPTAVTALLAAGLLAGGFTATTALALLALAGALELAGDRPRRRRATVIAWAAIAAPTLAAKPLVTLTALGVAAAITLPTAIGLGALGLLAVAGLVAADSAAGLATLWGAALVALPLAALPGAVPWRRTATAVLLAIAGATLLSTGAGAALGATLLVASASPAAPGSAAHRLWVLALSAPALLLAAYPWLREEPLAATLELAGLPAGWAVAALAVAVWAFLARINWPPRRRRLAIAATTVVALIVVRQAAGPAVWAPLVDAPVELAADDSPWESALSQPVGTVVVESMLANAELLAAGTRVLTVELEGPTGRVDRWSLANGSETGEWSARRDGEAPESPAAWNAFVAEGASLFGQRYRATWRLDVPRDAVAIRLSRSPGLPADLEIVVTALEVAP